MNLDVVKKAVLSVPKRLWIVFFITLFTPFTSYILMQFIFGAHLSDFSFLPLLVNSFCIGSVYFVLCAISARPILSSLICHILFAIWGTANYFVWIFRGSPILPWDLTAIGTAIDVVESYTFSLTWQMYIAIVLIAGSIFAYWRILFKFEKNLFTEKEQRIFRQSSCGITVVLLAVICFSPLLSYPCFKPDVWNQANSYKKGGTIAVFLRNLEFLDVEQPVSPTVEELEQTVSELPQTPVSSEQPPNIIAIMNESWADFEEFGNISLSTPVNQYISTLPNSIWGHTYTSVFGAGTSASEFEFLTGNSMAFLPSGSIPYQQYITSPTSSIVSHMRNNGYRTVSIHPGTETSWQRNTAYPLLGFDEFKFYNTLNAPRTALHGYISDETSFNQIIWEYEHKAPNEKLFVFNVTIQNHGGYDVENYPTQVTVDGYEGQFPKAEQYLTLVSETDKAFKNLIDYFSNVSEPTIILMFGDHQPSVEPEFLNLAYGVTQDKMTMEQYMNKYRTPFVIWANYPLPDTEIPDTSLNFLSQYLLRYSGLPLSKYDEYLWNLHQTLPAITFVGYTDTAGNAYSHLETNDFTPLIDEYRAFQYNNLFGESQRHSEWFAPLWIPQT